MARKKNKEEKPPDLDYSSVKCGVGSIISEQFREPLIAIISMMSIAATEMAVLAGLLCLYLVNTAVDNENFDFFNADGEKFIQNCFYSVLRQNKDNMPARFRNWVEEACGADFEWPSNSGFGNCFKYIFQQYIDNTSTNLRTHCASRLKKFFRVRVYQMNRRIAESDPTASLFDETDVKNAVNWTYKRWNSCENEERTSRLDVLLDALKECRGPEDSNVLDYVNNHWFHSMQMWILIQREIQMFHRENVNVYNSWNLFHKYPLFVQRPAIPEPPRIKNFTVIPTCTFQRRHITIDTDALYALLCKASVVPSKEGKRKKRVNITPREFASNRSGSWSLFFNLEKIAAMVKGKKTFDFTIISDGVSASVRYLRTNTQGPRESDECLIRKLESGEFSYELGIDPGMRTWNATVRKDIWTGEEVNLKTSSKRYHYETKQGVRNKKAEQISRLFVYEEQCDLEQTRNLIGEMPSPRGSNWASYIKHRLRMMENGINTYTTRSYARLRLDKHIEWTRAIDKIAANLVNHKPALIYFGTGSFAANSPIRIKKHVRCPGTRKLINAFKKRGDCVIRMIDEYMTSQTCAKCFGRFNRRTKSFRYKLCANCNPNMIAMLPAVIVTDVSKRALQMKRTIVKMWREMSEMGDAIARTLFQSNTRHLVSKKQCFSKIWQANANVNVEVEGQHKTVWHRDICAAKLILYRGHCELFGVPIHPALQRPANPMRGIPL